MSEPSKEGRSAEILFKVRLDERNRPVSIDWSASDSDVDGDRKTKSIMLSVWNEEEQRAMHIDLWTPGMLVDEMKMFVFQTLITMADTLELAAGEKAMANEMRGFGEQFAQKMGFRRAETPDANDS